jgi:hypothetical protein
MKTALFNRLFSLMTAVGVVIFTGVFGLPSAGAAQKPSISSFKLAQTLPIIREQNGFIVSAKILENTEKNSLTLRVLRDSRAYSGIVHTYFVSKDFQNLYFQYPEETQPGSYELELPPMLAGTYDLILEITGGGGHEHDNPAFVQVFDVGLELTQDSGDTAWLKRLSTKSGVLEVQTAGKRSKFEWNTLLDNQPVGWGDYYVHQFILATDWSYFKHDHPKNTNKLGLGSVAASFPFPKSGEYALFVFLESGLRIDGKLYRPTLRYPDLIQVP